MMTNDHSLMPKSCTAGAQRVAVVGGLEHDSFVCKSSVASIHRSHELGGGGVLSTTRCDKVGMYYCKQQLGTARSATTTRAWQR